MKLLKVLIPAGIIVAIFTLTAPINSCTKTKYVHDTTTVAVHDTTRDTTIIHDTVGCCNINEDMIAYYTFTGGSLKDSSGNQNDIVFNNATKTTDRYGNANGAYLFDGSTNYMRIANSTSLNSATKAITIVAVVKINGFYAGTAHGNQILSKGYPDYAKGWYSMRFIDYGPDPYAAPLVNQERFSGVYGDNNPVGTAAAAGADTVYAATGKWYTLIFTYDGTFANFYVNGVLKDSKAKVSVAFTPNSNDLFIGKHEDPSFPYWFNGVVDEIRIYKKAFCPSAVQKISAVQTGL